MEEANNLVNILLTNGGTVTMAVLFIIFLYLDRKDRKDKEPHFKRKFRYKRNLLNDNSFLLWNTT